ncbi:MAG: hypothetical protein WBA41_12225 [Rivularia sp. (in: cyanobacteria)]
MRNQLIKKVTIALATATAIISATPFIVQAQQRNSVAHPRTPYRLSFYNRHALEDEKLYKQVLSHYNKPPRIEPTMELYAPYTARATGATIPHN